jgi:predicted nucleic acid-binding protein
MTHLLDTSAILAHHLAEPGADRIQRLFDDQSNSIGISVVTLLELECRLHDLGLNPLDRRAEVAKYKLLFDEIVPITESICATAVELKLAATARLPSIDAFIAAAAKSRSAILVHRDPHFLHVPARLLSQELLPEK